MSPEGGSTRETSAAKDSKKMFFEAKMMQISNDKSTVAPSEKVNTCMLSLHDILIEFQGVSIIRFPKIHFYGKTCVVPKFI